MKRICSIILASTVLFAWALGPSTAQESVPTLQVEAGFDGYCHSGNWCPVYVVLSNEGADIEGELRIFETGKENPDVYARQVLLPSHARKAYFLVLPSSELSSSYGLAVQLWVGRTMLASASARVRSLSLTDRLYGVVSSSPSALNFLSDVAPPDGTTTVAHLNLETLPPEPLAWEGLDALILSDVDTTSLGSEQQQALGTWVAHGGHLIVGGGAGAARTAAGVAGLLPVTVGGMRPVDDLWALGENSGVPTIPGPYAVAEADLRDGEALIEQGGLILLARRAYGAGRVDFLAFDAGLNLFARWDDTVHLWRSIVEPEMGSAGRLDIQNAYNAYDSIQTIPGLHPPSVLQILAFMLVYIVLIGPVNYLVLRKMDRREWAWLTIPALILGFTIFAYLSGFQIRGNKAIIHQLAAVYVPEGSATGRVTEVVGFFSPRRATYAARGTGAGVRSLPGDYYGVPAAQPLRVVEESETWTIDGLRVDVGGIRPFLVEGYASVPEVESDLRLVADAAGGWWLEGTLRNGALPLEGAVLIVGQSEQRWERLNPGEEVPVHVWLGAGGYSVSTSGIAERILGPGDYWNDPDLYRRYQFLQAIVTYPGSYSGEGSVGPGVYLVGWVEESPLSLEVVGRPFLTATTSLYVYALPAVALETRGTITIPSSLIERRVEETRGYVNVWPEGFHMDPGSEITFRFVPWSSVLVHQVDALTLELQGSTTGSPSPPQVSFWNRETDAWEAVDVDWGQSNVPDATAYVTPSGEVLLRVTTDSGTTAEMQGLTLTITGR